MQQMKLFIDENNISYPSETSSTDSTRITAIQENIEDAVASKDHEKLLDN